MRKFLATFLSALWLLTQAAQAEFIINELQGFSVGGAAAPAIIGSPTEYLQVGEDNPYTLSHTTAAGTQCVVVIFTWGKNATRTVSTVTWSGSGMTLGDGVNDNTGGSNFGGTWLYYFNAPAITTANIVVTLNADTDAMTMEAFNLDKACVVNTSGNSATQVDAGDKTVSLVTTAPTLILGARIKTRVTGSMVPATGVTEVADIQNGPGSIATHWYGKVENAAGTVAFGAAITSSVTGDALVGVAFQ